MGKKIARIIAVLIFLIGLILFAYPYVADWYAKRQNEKVMNEFKEDLERMKQTLSEEGLLTDIKNGDADVEGLSEEGRNLAKLYEDMKAYNQKLIEEGQEGLHDPFAYEIPAFDLTEYGFGNNVIGIIDIEKMDVSMPLYLGASKENMKKGAVVLSETSMPTGENSTNMVVAAHRGYRGIKMFRDIQNMDYGDIIKVTTPFDTLTYKVTEIKIVLPDEISEILIQKDKTLLTLVTCHPYTKNTHRYLVVAELANGEGGADDGLAGKESHEDDKNGKEKSEEEKKSDIQNGNSQNKNDQNGGGQNGGGQNGGSEGDADLNGKESGRMIWLETYVPVIGIAVVLIMIVVGMIFIVIFNKNQYKNSNK